MTNPYKDPYKPFCILEYHVQGYQEKAVAEVELGARQCTSWSTVPTRLLLGRIRPVMVVAVVSSSEVSQNPAGFQGLEVWDTVKMYKDTVDGRIIAPVEVGVCRIFYRVSYIPGGARFLPSTVLSWSKHVWLLALYRANIGQELYIENHASKQRVPFV